VDEWLRSYEEGRRSGERDGFAALGSDESFLGVGLAPHISRPDGEIELGYIVAAEARGRGVGTEILRQLTEWAFADSSRATRIPIRARHPRPLRLATPRTLPALHMLSGAPGWSSR
jgi:RimJ/RimL family protein N-acetyltransferase